MDEYGFGGGYAFGSGGGQYDDPSVGADEEITQTDAWSVIDAYFEEKGLVRQQIDSFNEFIGISLQEIIDDSGQITIDAPNQFGLGQDHAVKLRARVEFNQVFVTKPTFHEKDGTVNHITPQQARLRNLTYSVALYSEVQIDEEEFNEEDGQWRTISDGRDADEVSPRELIGKIPLMLRSEHCVLTSMKLDDKGMTELGECIYDQGGYFVVTGSEKVKLRFHKHVLRCSKSSQSNLLTVSTQLECHRFWLRKSE